jgi:hypothetical protein
LLYVRLLVCFLPNTVALLNESKLTRLFVYDWERLNVEFDMKPTIYAKLATPRI